ncbi:MAG: YIP1 family protein [Gammaproteobacteria bacterium]|nr:YIP1 family protein [Gammaproteobacteria bacterium]
MDLTRTLALIKGALFDPDKTWDTYLPEAGDWSKTAMLLTGPLIIGSGILAYLLDLIIPNTFAFIPQPTLMMALLGIIIQAAAAVIIAFVVAFLAGMFKGKNSFAHALAATSLAFVPGYVGNVAMQIPWIGGLLALGLGIYGLVLLWRILPKYLDIPDSSRVGHYILSLVCSIVVLVALSAVVGASVMRSGTSGFTIPDMGSSNTSGSGSTARSSGAFGELERQGRILEEAENDVYEPPESGMLSRDQVEQFVSVVRKTRAYQEDQTERLQELSEKAEAGEVTSFGEAFSGMASMVGIGAAEMEVVKTGGGNWAEHQWIKEQLQIARIQRDINDTVRHNYALYQDYEEELRELGY